MYINYLTAKEVRSREWLRILQIGPNRRGTCTLIVLGLPVLVLKVSNVCIVQWHIGCVSEVRYGILRKKYLGGVFWVCFSHLRIQIQLC